MLLDFDKGGIQVTRVPFAPQFNHWKARMNPGDVAAIKTEIHRQLASGLVTTSWMTPGADWSNTVFEPIYTAIQDEVEAAKCFGLFVIECVLERSDDEQWGYGHYEKDGVPIKGRSYFKLAAV